MGDQNRNEHWLSSDESLAEEIQTLFGVTANQNGDLKKLWQETHKLPEGKMPRALCFSGGGIRSGTFCLGVLQGLAEEDELENYHYLSTASGGGYIGSWLSRWRATGTWDKEKMLEPDRSVPDANSGLVNPIRRLRGFSSYMSPTWGFSLDALTVLSIFLRNLLYNLLVWIPLLLGFAALPLAAIALVGSIIGPTVPIAMPVLDVGTSGAFSSFAEFMRYPLEILESLINDTSIASARITLLICGILMVPWFVIAIMILCMRGISEEWREKLSRWSAIFLRVFLYFLTIMVIFYHIPFAMVRYVDLSDQLSNSGTLGLGAIVTTSVAGIIGFWSQYGQQIQKKAFGLFAKAGMRMIDLAAIVAIFVLITVMAIASHIAVLWIIDPGSRWMFPTDRDLLLLSFLHSEEKIRNLLFSASIFCSGSVLLAFIASWFVGANRYSLHSLYGNRLVRAYLGSAQPDRNAQNPSDFSAEDNIPMSKLYGGQQADDRRSKALFHVVNMTLNLSRPSDHRRDLQERKAATFTATPLHCGSPQVGYLPSEIYSGGEGMTLGRAMTISGAAATPNMGYHSSKLMALIMAFLNIRLGWWLPNPKNKIQKSEPEFGLLQVVSEAFSLTTDKSKWLYLSDGGHFDNLGLYEMVRRRVRHITVVDAGCDGDFDYSDLHNAIRMIAVDFGVQIELPSQLPGQDGPGEYQRIVVGKILYSSIDPALKDGFLYYLKPILTGEEPPRLTSYAQTSRRNGKTFPHHSTADQFFNETQFESYRALGKITAEAYLKAKRKFDHNKFTNYPLLSNISPQRLPPRSPPDQSTPAGPLPPPEPVLKGLDGLLSGLQSLGPTGLLTGALTAAGTLGVVGTLSGVVTLKVTEEIGIKSPPAMELKLNEETAGKISSGIPLDQNTTAKFLSDLDQKLIDISKALASVQKGEDGEDGEDGKPGTTLNSEELRSLTQQIAILNGRLRNLPPTGTVDYSGTLNNIKTRLNDIEQNLPNASQDSARLDNLAAEIRNLRTTLDTIRPRRNVRGR